MARPGRLASTQGVPMVDRVGGPPPKAKTTRLGTRPLGSAPAEGEALALPPEQARALAEEGLQAKGLSPRQTRSLLQGLRQDLNSLEVPPLPEVGTEGSITAIDAAPVIEARAGTETNRRISGRYHEVGTRMDAYLGHPGVNNWPQIGQHASATAGMAIAPLETVLTTNTQELWAMLKDGRLWDLFKEFTLPMVGAALKKAGWSDLKELVTSPLDLAKALGTTAAALPELVSRLPEWVEHPERIPGDLGSGAYELVKDVLAPLVPDETVKQLWSDMETFHRGLVTANAGIHNNFGPAFDAFLDAEAKGQDGVAAVRGLVASGRISDPSGLVVGAMGLYRQAHGSQDPEARKALVRQANLLVALQEQYHVGQPIFEEGRFSELTAAVTPQLKMADPLGTTPLLPHGGNWASFTDRMGMVELPATAGAARFRGNEAPGAQVFRLVAPQGQPRYFQLNPDPKAREGTIPAYFDQLAEGGEASARAIAQAPATAEAP